MNNSEKRWLSPAELEDEYGFSISYQAKSRMRKNPSIIPFVKIGKFIKYDRKKIDKWLEDHEIMNGANNE